ncbi:DUF459 domain-containing protein [Falsochrobactrum sp. TDYN1]|uniref:DUF459 domain-containing protein n=1 Tax=Falsochrobactrum tianjinense TaxID=2706015 RepID=A0A949PP65_9HYPH|nr:DUF459 domain-containing protein [Falsochrobactrum sp. TDYN1]MBV2144272.1 DUF459 domain-containing protein [Falsochrobactrum sp. TDYN1]
MQTRQFKLRASSVAATMLAVFAVLCLILAPASAQERPRTIFDLLFGQRQAEPQRQYEQPKRQRTRPAKPKRSAKSAAPTARAKAPAIVKPEIDFVEKSADAKKVLVVGDFIGDGLAEGLEIAFAANPDISIVNRVNGSSGFVRDDYFDWPANIAKILEEEKPAAVIVMIGSNDRQPINIKGQNYAVRSPEWTEEYQRRVSSFTKDIADGHYPLIWVGQPPFRPRGMSQDMLALNEIYRTTAEKAGGKFVDVWDGFVDEEGNFSQTGFDINGQTARLRANDGINTTSAGKRKLAFYAEKPLKALLGDTKDSEQLLPAAGASDPSKPVDRIAPVNLRDIGRDDSGVLLGSRFSLPQNEPETQPADPKITPGRADDFSWPRNSAKN